MWQMEKYVSFIFFKVNSMLLRRVKKKKKDQDASYQGALKKDPDLELDNFISLLNNKVLGFKVAPD